MNHLLPFISAHWPLCLALVLIIGLILINEGLNKKQQGKSVSSAKVIELMNHHGAIVFDLRANDAYLAGHIIHAMALREDDLHLPRLEKYKDKPIILVCARGTQSAQCAVKMRKLGFSNPLVLSGGMASWQADQLPLVKGKK